MADPHIRRIAILGATGDLTRRSLLPAITSLIEQGRLPADFEITAIGRRDWDDARYREWIRQGPTPLAATEAGRRSVLNCVQYRAADVTVGEQLRDGLSPLDEALIVYLALPPALLARTLGAISSIGLPGGSRLVVEKPFAEDLASARALNDLVHASFPEDAVYRIDHFLHKQTVQNILGLRFANRVFERLWTQADIERVDIIWDETLGLEGRAGYYDATGALLDVVQNHLLQLLALVAMEPPATMTARDLRDRKVEALRAVRCLDASEVASGTVRARYTQGTISDRTLGDYTAEPRVDPNRGTETFAEVKLPIDNWRWGGTPFRLRTGKALGRDRREIVVTFRGVPHLAFDAGRIPSRNQLRLSMEPDTITLGLTANAAGDPFDLETLELGARLAPQEVPAYGRLLLGVLSGDPTFSIRNDEAEESWRVIEPIRREWARGSPLLREYPAGSGGPTT